jgi:hypothetical protein
MPTSCTLTLVAATSSERASQERIAAWPGFARDAGAFGFLYTAEDPACIALADCIADRLWLRPRGLFGLGTPHGLLELARSHRFERIVVVAPEQRLQPALTWLRAHEPRAHVTQVERVPVALFELSIADRETTAASQRTGDA